MCFGSREKGDDVGAARSRELDKVIRADEKRLAKEVKLLLLGTNWSPRGIKGRTADFFGGRTGAGESGKSTVLKQMKLIYAQGFSKNEKMEWKPVVFTNVIQSFRLIFDAMNDLGIKFENPDNEASHPPLAPPTDRQPIFATY